MKKLNLILAAAALAFGAPVCFAPSSYAMTQGDYDSAYNDCMESADQNIDIYDDGSEQQWKDFVSSCMTENGFDMAGTVQADDASIMEEEVYADDSEEEDFDNE